MGWTADDGVIGVTRITLNGSVRMLRGPGDVSFFGVDAKTGVQIKIEKIGEGRIGEDGPFTWVPLL